MDDVGGRLRDCPDCGRTFNKHINSRCPACETELDDDYT
ncbi:hypothetical protein SAMN05216226_11046 [Halovenus aranensis]|jgi:predicted Zn-ribbon and HTH transcriptional regulator|uniref:Small CPxCG-related zinc finger protein n=1 Tax=Halovenus aranensis TaxID=890420 RepID=A0A1G8X0W7_9EURY|nr:hypothetical protein SAMN05216226_11046 [Halovenus aranensis]